MYLLVFIEMISVVLLFQNIPCGNHVITHICTAYRCARCCHFRIKLFCFRLFKKSMKVCNMEESWQEIKEFKLSLPVRFSSDEER